MMTPWQKKEKKTKGQTNVYKTPHRKIEAE